jgi:hypothetical protein
VRQFYEELRVSVVGGRLSGENLDARRPISWMSTNGFEERNCFQNIEQLTFVLVNAFDSGSS